MVLASEKMVAAWGREIRRSTNRKYLPVPCYKSGKPPTFRNYHIGGVRVIPVKEEVVDTIPELYTDRFWICDTHNAVRVLEDA